MISGLFTAQLAQISNSSAYNSDNYLGKIEWHMWDKSSKSEKLVK